MSPEEIHSLGEHGVQRIETAMQAILTETKFSGTLEGFRQKMANSPEQHFNSKEEMLAYCRNIAKMIELSLPNQFRHIPMLLYGVRPIPPTAKRLQRRTRKHHHPISRLPGGSI